MAISSTVPQVEFSCGQPHQGSPDNPTLVTPDVSFERSFFGNGRMVMPDGVEVRYWGFEDGTQSQPLPSATTRVVEDQVVHVTLHSGKKVHTIHHHGLEPEPINDGVGHTSFEITGHYTYQFKPSQAGTFFYHCHVNTVLHVQMGMFGPLIVDPKPDPTAPPLPQGWRRAFNRTATDVTNNAPDPRYAHEQAWIAIAFDPRWHDLNHAAGLCGDDAGLNDFRPKYILIGDSNGRSYAQPFAPGAIIPEVAITAKSGEPILIRYLDSGYYPQVVAFKPNANGDVLDPRIIASDGRPFRNRSGVFTPSQLTPQPVTTRDGTPNRWPGIPVFMCSSAERYDLMLNSPDFGNVAKPGVYPVEIEFRHWRHPHPLIDSSPGGSGTAPVAIARTTITIT